MGRLGAGGAIMSARVIDPLYKIARELGIADDALSQVIKDYEAGRRYTVDRADDFTFNKEPRSNGARVGGKSIAGAAKHLGTMHVAAASYALAGRLDAARKAVARLAEIHVSFAPAALCKNTQLKALDANCDVTGVFRLHGGCVRRPRL